MTMFAPTSQLIRARSPSQCSFRTWVIMALLHPHTRQTRGVLAQECGEGIISRYLAEGKLLTNLLNLAASMMLENGSSTSPIISWP